MTELKHNHEVRTTRKPGEGMQIHLEKDCPRCKQIEQQLKDSGRGKK